MPIDLQTLSTGSLNTKWKEPYVSASLNERFVGLVPPGVYRGLILAADPALGDRTILIATDPITNDHVAVSESSTGYSITYRDATSGNMTVSLAAYSSVTIVLCLFISYATNSTTTGTLRAYTASEFTALSGSISGHLVILGTIVVPASGTIAASAITPALRTPAALAWQNGMVPGISLVRNSGFELGSSGDSYGRSSPFWNKSVTVGTGAWQTTSAVVYSGQQSQALTITAGALTGDLSQLIGVETGPVLATNGTAHGELLSVSVAIKQITTFSAGTLQFFAEWGPTNAQSSGLTTSTVSLTAGSADSAFRVVTAMLPCPSGPVLLRKIGIRATGLTPVATGIVAYLDNVTVTLVPRDAQHVNRLDEATHREVFTTAVVVEDPAAQYDDPTPLLRFDASHLAPAPDGYVEGQLVLDRKDQDFSTTVNMPPALTLQGRIAALGAKLLGAQFQAILSRIHIPVSPFTGAIYTLLLDALRDDSPTTIGGIRVYAKQGGGLFITYNAAWNNTDWVPDVIGNECQALALVTDFGTGYYFNAGSAAFSDGSWSTGTLAANLLTASVEVSTGGAITLDGTAYIKQGNHSYSIPFGAGVCVPTQGDGIGVTVTAGIPGYIQGKNATALYTLGQINAVDELVSVVVWGSGATGTAPTYRLMISSELDGSFTPCGSLVTSGSNAVTVTVTTPTTLGSGATYWVEVITFNTTSNLSLYSANITVSTP